MSFIGSAIAFLAFQAVSLDVNVKEGESIAAEKTIVVKVTSKNPVNQVEFYVGDDLRETDSSSPYEFKFDALAENEGPVKLKFAAYTTEGESASKTITIKVDNMLGLGADAHVAKANESLTQSKWDAAILEARIALKAKPGFNPARLALSRAYLGKGVYDQAQKFAEDAIAADPNYSEASDLLTAINLKRGFNTFYRGGEALSAAANKDTLNVIGTALKSAVKTRKKVLDDAFDKLTAPTDATLKAYSDSAIRAGRYSAAIQALTPAFRSDTRKNDLADRLAFAQMRAGRFNDAILTLNENNRQGGLDAYGFALAGVLKTLAGDYSAADDMMRQAVLSDSEDLGVRTAQAFIAVQRDRTDTLRQLATALAKDEGQRPEVNFYLSTVYSKMGEYAASRDAFERAALAEPALAELYVLRGNESLALLHSGRLDENQNGYHIAAARMFYETALEGRPEAAEALTGIALVSLLEKKPADAVRFATAATQAAPGYAAGYYVKSAACLALETDLRAAAERILRTPKDGVLTAEQRTQMRQLQDDANRYGKEAQTANDTAGKLDSVNLQGRELPKDKPAYEYFAKYGRVPLITAPK